MLTRMTDEDWERTVQVFRAVRSRRGSIGRNDRRFLEAVHYFCVHNITWRALPEAFGNWNSIWKRFWRLSRAGVFVLRPAQDEGLLRRARRDEPDGPLGPDVRRHRRSGPCLG